MEPHEVSSSSSSTLQRSDTFKTARRLVPSSSSSSSSSLVCHSTNPRSFAAVTSAATTTRRHLPRSHSHNGSVPFGVFPQDARQTFSGYGGLSSLLKSFLGFLSLPATNLTLSFSPCKRLSLAPPPYVGSPLGRKVTGTLFGPRRGHVSFAIQEHPQSNPVLLLELATTTSALVREMSSGLVRIALECEKRAPMARLLLEPGWSMYCNGRKCGHATSRKSTGLDLHVLRTIGNITVGAGMIPIIDEDGGKSGGNSEGELLYMRAKFERVVGSRDSEAYYMLSPEGNGGPELSIFLLRI
ncbi:hypothetical protein MLD38_007583 [Melastoma candidum]|uniref:Uncharacterized protein n=1 Tax=Melastoma candidum TaxID=119954 RepID=A0ACB9RSY0_9MYRT|nr:hypothetical protein MLD38_007583 [Melastoma candidum]